MHPANRAFWSRCKTRYPQYFEGDISVLEVGSYDVNGSVRDYFNVAKYVGVDWREGPSVDIVCLAQNINLGIFNTVISASMLEHDPYWYQSIERMVENLDLDGILLLSWGAALNQPHELHTAPDHKFHNLPAGKVLNLLKELEMTVSEFHYEGLLFPELTQNTPNNGMGEVCLVAFDNPDLIQFTEIDELLPEDRI